MKLIPITAANGNVTYFNPDQIVYVAPVLDEAHHQANAIIYTTHGTFYTRDEPFEISEILQGHL